MNWRLELKVGKIEKQKQKQKTNKTKKKTKKLKQNTKKKEDIPKTKTNEETCSASFTRQFFSRHSFLAIISV